MSAQSRLHIALVAPPRFENPSRSYGGVRVMMDDLARSLLRLGHQVTLIGAGRPGASAHFLAAYSEPPSHPLDEPVPGTAVPDVRLEDLDVDVVHDHSPAGPLTALNPRIPTVTTVHGPASGEQAERLRRLGDSVGLVSTSTFQRMQAPDLNWVGTVHNGVDLKSFPFRERKEDYTLFLGRFSPDKGAHLAIDAARKAGRRILLAGGMNEPSEHEYFDTHIRPRLGDDAVHVGEADGPRKRELLANAHCLLFPSRREESFGMVMTEAMASGTPVVALRGGAVGEVLVDGVTGYICDGPADLAEAVEAAGGLNPADCRMHVKRNFDALGMAMGYEKIYELSVRDRRPAPFAA
ncbi:glycosyltransferase family 4 protein [Nonomuraea sp. NPDC049607]|uniref:glycosyltransferase family 4 protein n=1 Tax=unclassified Nonomuraea TaxID=2593643 RepID=UPI0034424598